MYVCMNIPVQRTSRLSCVQELSEHLSANYLIRYVEENMYVCMCVNTHVCMHGGLNLLLPHLVEGRESRPGLLAVREAVDQVAIG